MRLTNKSVSSEGHVRLLLLITRGAKPLAMPTGGCAAAAAAVADGEDQRADDAAERGGEGEGGGMAAVKSCTGSMRAALGLTLQCDCNALGQKRLQGNFKLKCPCACCSCCFLPPLDREVGPTDLCAWYGISGLYS